MLTFQATGRKAAPSQKTVIDFNIHEYDRARDESVNERTRSIDITGAVEKILRLLPKDMFKDENKGKFVSNLAKQLKAGKNLGAIEAESGHKFTPSDLEAIASSTWDGLASSAKGTGGLGKAVYGQCLVETLCFSVAKVLNPKYFGAKSQAEFNSLSEKDVENHTYKGAAMDIGALSREALAASIKILGEMARENKGKGADLRNYDLMALSIADYIRTVENIKTIKGNSEDADRWAKDQRDKTEFYG